MSWFARLAAGLIASIAVAGPVSASVVFYGSGTGTDGPDVGTAGDAIAATAAFEFVTYNFGAGPVAAVQITLSNTSASTTVRGNLVTGLFWSLSGPVGALSTTTAGFDGRAASVTLANGTTASNVDLAPAVNNTPMDGKYQLSNGPFGTANSGVSYSAFEYAIGTVGMGLTGFSGNAVNGDDYGIFASGSSVASGGLAAARPLISSSAVFWIAAPVGWTSLDQIQNVRITFGSLPDNYLDASRPVPLPAAAWLLLSGIAGLGFVGRRRTAA